MSEPSTAPPLQPTQPSRKGKKAWRKHVDITQLEAGLAEARDEQIAGGPVSSLPSTELFAADPAGSPALHATAQRAHARRQLTADRLLAQRSGAPGLRGPKRRAAPSSLVEEPTLGAPPGGKRARTNGVSYREYHRLRAVAYGGEGERARGVERTGDASFDPWADDGPAEQDEANSELAGLDFVSPPRGARAPGTLRREPVSLTADGRRVRAVRKPAAERSYNPRFDDWAARYEREGAKEVEAERKRLELEAEAQARLDLAEKAQAEEEEKERERSRRAEAGEEEAEAESEWEGIVSDAEAAAPEWLLKKRPERKTQAQRNRIARRRELEQQARAVAREKAKAQQAVRIVALAKEVRRQARIKAEALAAAAVAPAQDSSDDEGEVVLRRKQFGKARVPEPRLEILLPEDVPESLRRLKPEGNLLHDRYRSLVVRGKVESRRSTQQKKAKTKRTEKWSYKDWRLK